VVVVVVLAVYVLYILSGKAVRNGLNLDGNGGYRFVVLMTEFACEGGNLYR